MVGRAADVLIVLRFRPGQFLLRGEPLAAIVPADKVGTIETPLDRGAQSGTHIGCAALRITLQFCSRYREFPTT